MAENYAKFLQFSRILSNFAHDNACEVWRRLSNEQAHCVRLAQTLRQKWWEVMKRGAIVVPEGVKEVLLHACCAPCSSAIVEWLVQHDIRPTIFYYNPNIWPREEYEIRKNESKRHAESLGLTWIDGDYNHEQWREGVCGLEDEPERGRRCELCFTLRLTAAAQKAKELGIRHFTTTLASSRWKSLEQIDRAGHLAEQAVPGTVFWAQNWRKGGLYERRNQLLKEFDFYNQKYCGCEYSFRQ